MCWVRTHTHAHTHTYTSLRFVFLVLLTTHVRKHTSARTLATYPRRSLLEERSRMFLGLRSRWVMRCLCR